MRKLLWVALSAMVLGLGAGGCTIDDTYASCISTSDCNDIADECLEVDIPAASTFGGFCSHGCSSDFECEYNFGYDGVCYGLDGSSAICYQQCDFDTDCWSGNVCIEIGVGGLVDFICVPNNG